MNQLEELLLKAKETEENEDQELSELLEEMGIEFVSILLVYIKKTQNALDDLLQSDYETIEGILVAVMSDFKKMPSKRKLKKLLADREFLTVFDDEVNSILREAFIETVERISKLNGFVFDFNNLSTQISELMDQWLTDLPNLMKLTTDKAVESLLREAFKEGNGINWLKARLAELPEFSYYRARMTAITEALRMYSAGGYESMLQNDAVFGARWRHTFGIDDPRHSHELLDGTVIPKGEFFYIDGEAALFPRDPRLSAKQSIHCHCWLEPVLREEYLKGGEIKKCQDNWKMSQSHTFLSLIKQRIRKSFSSLSQRINQTSRRK